MSRFCGCQDYIWLFSAVSLGPHTELSKYVRNKCIGGWHSQPGILNYSVPAKWGASLSCVRSSAALCMPRVVNEPAKVLGPMLSELLVGH